MRTLGRILLGLGTLLLVTAGGLYYFGWVRPVGLNNLVNRQTAQLILDSPQTLTFLGFIDNTLLDFHTGKLNSYTEEKAEKDIARIRRARAELDRYGPEGLEGQESVTWEIMAWFYDDALRLAEINYGDLYRINQISGPTVNMPSFLTDSHQVISRKSAKRYVSRVREFGRVLREVAARVRKDRAIGFVPPDFVIEKSISGMRTFIEEGADGNILVTNFSDRLEEVEEIDADARAEFAAEARDAVAAHVIPGYETMIDLFEAMLLSAPHDAGVWRLPDGDKLYAAALKSDTTTDVTPDEVHEIGLSEVARIEAEMNAILRSQGFEDGTVAQRVDALMKDPQYLFPNTDQGRAEMIEYLHELVNKMMARTPEYFITIPEQALEILRVPEHAQGSAPGGYYKPPALDGSRPGRFYINQKDTADNPRWTLPTLVYHEGAPGHHFQLSAAQLAKGVPIFRKIYPFSAYSEGWALYAEELVKEMGIYDDDPLGDLGRLGAEMFRAVRLVVDTGIHHMRWSREHAIDYMLSKTGMTEAEVTREIERYSVWPGQACAYKIGHLTIKRLRARAEAELGDAFDLREFHETILGNGGMPLRVLEGVVDAWIADVQGASAEGRRSAGARSRAALEALAAR